MLQTNNIILPQILREDGYYCNLFFEQFMGTNVDFEQWTGTGGPTTLEIEIPSCVYARVIAIIDCEPKNGVDLTDYHATILLPQISLYPPTKESDIKPWKGNGGIQFIRTTLSNQPYDGMTVKIWSDDENWCFNKKDVKYRALCFDYPGFSRIYHPISK